VTDAENRLIATKSTEYIKDTVLPTSYYSQSNLENDGTSTLDNLVVEVVIESVDIGGTYNLEINKVNTSETGSVQSLNFEGNITSETTVLENLDITDLENGDYKFDLKITDPNGNTGEPEVLYYRKNEKTITLLGNVLGELEYILDNVKSYPNPFNEFYIIDSSVLLKIEIHDVNGRILIRKNLEIGKNRIDASKLASGYYIIQLKYMNKNARRIFIKH
jgi:hypothetical protein